MDSLTRKRRADYQDAMTDIQPKPPKPKMQTLSAYVPADLVKALDKAAKEINYTRSELLTKLVEGFLADRSKKPAAVAAGDAAHH